MELTDKQKTILQCIYNEGYRYIATDICGITCLYIHKPKKSTNVWDIFYDNVVDEDGEELQEIFNPKLTSWEDEEPFDIGKALGTVDWSTIPIDTKVLVKGKGANEWDRRYFAGYKEGKYQTFVCGETSWSTTTRSLESWDEAKLYQEEEEREE